MIYVLVHGGGSTARFWDRVAPLLPGRALAVDLPGRGAHPADLATITVEDEVASVGGDIDTAAGDDAVVLVAHSSGGLVVPGVVAALSGRVERIVLNAALVPPEGGCGLDGMQPRHAAGLSAAVETAMAEGRTITLPGPPDDPEQFRTTYGGEPLTDDDLAFVVDPVRCVPDTIHHYFQPVRWSLARGIPVTYVLNERDRPIPPALQEEMLGRLPDPPTVVRLPTGHLPAVTHPNQLAQAVA
ncbi:MAG TPA: alpha/beta hydrolase [Acidimicrobiales bacterium]|nr:alpha/beta hydrolase [Acidimicrobiales bacterium]